MADIELNTPTLNLMSFGGQVEKQTDNNYTDADKAKVDGIEAGAEVNVIEEVKRNGSALPVTDKTVNVVVPTKVSELDNDSNFATTTQLSDETTARTNADTTLQGNIDSETTARANADTTLQTAITNEATARTNADAAEVTARNTAITNAKELLFRDMWNTICKGKGTYNANTGYYELNEVTDITYSEAINIYQAIKTNMDSHISACWLGRNDLRTILFYCNGGNAGDFNTVQAFRGCISLLTIGEYGNSYFNVNREEYVFAYCRMLKKIIPIVDYILVTSTSNLHDFLQCNALETVNIRNLKVSLYLSDSPNISAASISYLITNKYDSTTAITVTLHATAYANLTGGSGDWAGLMAAGTAKGITWASA